MALLKKINTQVNRIMKNSSLVQNICFDRVPLFIPRLSLTVKYCLAVKLLIYLLYCWYIYSEVPSASSKFRSFTFGCVVVYHNKFFPRFIRTHSINSIRTFSKFQVIILFSIEKVTRSESKNHSYSKTDISDLHQGYNNPPSRFISR
ncbi:sub-telomeric 5Tm protein family Ftm3 [Schizosaccharomyces pombe]|uniref:UPF0742 protein SPAC977.02 n=2 Tax=Schizosaccharomyces pombe (strain 972 / ATCC 24843) TaxID=284812 RepID=YI72_SCHPO|nr:transmembrane helix domain-containing protein [Schizosaccharomyces pombe]NP_595030.1 transmembrane helix domain-containing protein [Schizosaccharomyces pombe]P0CU06.1 RecName: Full=UPF0742 protein SPAC750.04c [Schizosaccharomyces pombe 972h-]P0CU07.1 RecName: Full=UPF0742 protein SPAC977.02 [Schizosaccharomyces pombe 972h-]CAB69624.1 S. pombe specific 5Tm protein family [Schizosaccharomyces pombe]CAB98255.1 S. pombe specific 5Tm protein family [Schizosaccharomyces pombe]|eukprot:NP_592775.1 transmembrane helix domain-containing protein [Schizosaccharomyces pombe]